MNLLNIQGSKNGAHSLGPTEMSEGEFASFSQRIHSLTGIVLPARKRQLVISRLSKRLRALGLDGFGAYLDHLDSVDGREETGELINVITTNLTSFFRESHHFEDMVQTLTRHPDDPGLIHSRRYTDPGTAERRRIWSAGCSTGEEAYSIAIAVLQGKLAAVSTDLRILATDLDTSALKQAETAVYPAERIDACPPFYRKGFFTKLPDGRMRVSDRVRDLISFNQLNLLSPWPMSGPFDVIFCRNVLIYFSDEDKRTLVERFVTCLRPGGTLYLGHSETMLGHHPQLDNLGRTIFRKRL